MPKQDSISNAAERKKTRPLMCGVVQFRVHVKKIYKNLKSLMEKRNMKNRKAGVYSLVLTFIFLLSIGCSGGGSNNSSGENTDGGSFDEWMVLSSMPTARAEFGVSSVNGKMYAIGGISASTLSHVEEYDPITDIWSRKADMPTARRLLVVASVNNKIYAIGGVDGSTDRVTRTNVTEEYDPSTDTWAAKTPLPLEYTSNNILCNQYIGGAAANGKIYIVAYTAGGNTAQSPTYIYDPLTDTWETGEPVPFTYTRFSVTTLNNEIYVLSSGKNKIAKYDAESDIWLSVPSPNINRTNAQIIASNGKLFTIGGIIENEEGNNVVSTVEEYDPSTDKWVEKENMPTPRHSAGLVALNDEIYVIGGSESLYTSDILPLSSVEVSAFDGSDANDDTNDNNGGDTYTEWSIFTSMPTARAELGAAAVNGKIYAIGGISASTVPFVEEYDPNNNIWSRKSDMPTKRRLMVVASVNNKIYAIGGVDGSTDRVTRTNVTEEYDPSTDTWAAKTPLPLEYTSNNILSNQYIGGAAANGKIYIVAYTAGGNTAQSPTYIYDPVTDTWETGEPVPFTHTRFSVTTLNNEIYVLSSEKNKIAKYDAESDIWLSVPSPNINRTNAQIIASNGKLFTIGGIVENEEGNNVVSTVEEYDPSTDKWVEKENMPTPRHSAGLVALNDEIYVIGGSESLYTSDILPLSSVEVSAFDGSDANDDTNDNNGGDTYTEWSIFTSMPTARAELGAAAVNGKIYAIGGISASTVPFVEEYDPNNNIWSRKSDMPTKRRLMVVASVNNKIYAIGGVDGSTSRVTRTNVTEEYDPSTDTWATKTPLPLEYTPSNTLSNQYIGGAAANGKIYIVAYTAGGNTAQSPTYIYDPLTDTWETGEPVPFTHTRFSVTTLNNKIYVLSSGINKIVKYDAESDVWLSAPSPNINRTNAQIIASNGKLYTIGGIVENEEGSNVVSTVEEYEPSTDKWVEKENMPTPRHSAGLVALNGAIYALGGSKSLSTLEVLPLSAMEVKSAE